MNDIYYQLSEVQRINKQIDILNAEIDSLKQCLLLSGMNYESDRVQSSPSDKMSDVFAKVDEKERERETLRNQIPAALNRIQSIIARIDDETKKKILTYRFIGCYPVHVIQEKMYYEEKSTVYKHIRESIALLNKSDTIGH